MFWQRLRVELERAWNLVGVTNKKMGRCMRQYWGLQQRFFKQMLLASKV